MKQINSTLKLTLLVLASSLIGLTSCKKDDDKSAVTKENIAGNYKFIRVTLKVGSGTAQDITNSIFDPCELDDITSLKTDFTYFTSDAGTLCNPSSADTGTWNLPSATTFVLDGETYTINRFDGNIFEVFITDISGGQTETYTFTLDKQ